MRSLRFSSVLLALVTAGAAACATADPGGGGGDDDPMSPDADPAMPDAPPVDPDAPPVDPDAPPAPMAVTLSQNNATNIVAGNSAGCINGLNHTAENSYYRLFNLTQMGVTGQFTATSVDFGIEDATQASGTQNVQVKLHTVNGAFQTQNMTLLYGQNVTVANTNGTPRIQTVNLTTPVVVPPGSQLAVELFVPDGTTTETTFFVGSNAAGETGASYVRAPDPEGCDIQQPSTMAQLGFPTMHMVLTVSGTTP